MCAAEGRKKVVQGILVRQVHHCKLRADFVAIAVIQVVMANRQVE
jgi:hypothetical protein